jgi:hypothetical protein
MHKINKNTWKNLMKQGYTLPDIDEMDIFYLFDLFATESVVYAEEVPWL